MKESTKKDIFETVEMIMAEFCDGCFLHKQIKKDYGRRAAHRFCISDCTVGEQLKLLGEKLT